MSAEVIDLKDWRATRSKAAIAIWAKRLHDELIAGQQQSVVKRVDLPLIPENGGGAGVRLRK